MYNSRRNVVLLCRFTTSKILVSQIFTVFILFWVSFCLGESCAFLWMKFWHSCFIEKKAFFFWNENIWEILSHRSNIIICSYFHGFISQTRDLHFIHFDTAQSPYLNGHVCYQEEKVQEKEEKRKFSFSTQYSVYYLAFTYAHTYAHIHTQTHAHIHPPYFLCFPSSSNLAFTSPVFL